MGKTSSEETKLKEDFGSSSLESTEELDLNDAIEYAGFGFGTLLYSLGPFLFFCLEGGEIIVLSIVGLMLRCEWGLTTFWISALQISVFFGLMAASFLSSGVGDKWGRKPVALCGTVGAAVVGVLSGIVTEYWQLLVLRTMLGCFLGLAMGPVVTITAEISTIRYRGFLTSYISLSWGIGASITSALAYFVVEPYGWRGLMIGTALMFSTSIPFYLFATPESPRWDLKNGNVGRAEQTVNYIAKLNCSQHRNLGIKRTGEEEKEEKDEGWLKGFRLIKSQGRVLDFALCGLIGLFGMFVYYVLGYGMPRFLNEGYCGEAKKVKDTCIFEKNVLFDLGVISLFEPLSIVVAVILINVIGRKKTFNMFTWMLILASIGLYFCANRTLTNILFVFCKSGAAVAAFSSFIIAAEYFPTEIRSFAMGLTVTIQRIGACLGIACTQFVFDLSPRLLIGTMQIAALVVSVALCLLKKEMMGQQLE